MTKESAETVNHVSVVDASVLVRVRVKDHTGFIRMYTLFDIERNRVHYFSAILSRLLLAGGTKELL